MKRIGLFIITCLLATYLQAEYSRSLTVQDWAHGLRLHYPAAVHYVGGSFYGGYNRFQLNGSNLSALGGVNAGLAFQYKMEYKAFRLVMGLDASYAGDAIMDDNDYQKEIPLIAPDPSMTYRFMLYGLDEKQHSLELGLRLMLGADFKGMYILAGLRLGLPMWTQYNITTKTDRIIIDNKTNDYYSNMPDLWLFSAEETFKDRLHLLYNPQVSAEWGFNMDKVFAYRPIYKRQPMRMPENRELVHYEFAIYANVGCITNYKACQNESILTYKTTGGEIDHVRSHFDDATFENNICMPWNVGIKFNIYFEIYNQPRRPRPGMNSDFFDRAKPIIQTK